MAIACIKFQQDYRYSINMYASFTRSLVTMLEFEGHMICHGSTKSKWLQKATTSKGLNMGGGLMIMPVAISSGTRNIARFLPPPVAK